MKSLIFVFCLFFSCQAVSESSPSGQEYAVQYAQTQADSLLMGIEQKIYQTFVRAMMDRNETDLLKIKTDLANLYQQKNQNLIQYWRAYLGYYQAIYALKMGKKDESEKFCEESIDLLENLKNKNSEDHAMIALLKSFSIQFKAGVKVPFISSSVKQNGEKALALNAKNLRAYYVCASNDFYTPEQYGGGKETEKYLLKAIALPAQEVANPYLPSWGKEESYEMLIKYYIEKEKWVEAKKYFQEAIALYPENYPINQLASKLVGK